MTFDFSNTVSNILKKSKHNFLGIPRFKRLSSIPIIAKSFDLAFFIFCAQSKRLNFSDFLQKICKIRPLVL